MRQTAPVLLMMFLAGMFVSTASASVQPTPAQKSLPALVAAPRAGAAQNYPDALDPHPFYTEFYLHQFAAEENHADARQSRYWFSPVVAPLTNAASNMSKRVATLRHALGRMMP